MAGKQNIYVVNLVLKIRGKIALSAKGTLFHRWLNGTGDVGHVLFISENLYNERNGYEMFKAKKNLSRLCY